MFVNSFNYFRGIAILFIVAGHCYGISGWWINTFPEKLLAAVVSGGTALFVFISGFLFHHIFYKNFNYKKFMSNKIKNVYSPYLVMSAIPILYSVFMLHSGPYNDFFFIKGDNAYYAYVRPLFLYLWTGRIFDAYWYLSFIMIIFLLSPLFIKFIGLSGKLQLLIITCFSIISMVVQRPIDNLHVFQSVLYFAPVYMFGIFASMNKETIYSKMAGKEIHLLALILAMAAIQVLVYHHSGNFHKAPFTMAKPDIMFLQKLVMCIFFMIFLHRFEDKNVRSLHKLAEASFAIYFIHPVILDRLYKIGFVFPTRNLGVISWFISIMSLVLVSFIIARCIKFLAKKHSRQIIGW